jgi:K+-sensing histidine kinase KdpD
MREERSRILYEVAWGIATAAQRKDLIPAICQRIGNFLGGECDISLKAQQESLKPFERVHFSQHEQETVRWVLNNGKPAGLSTETMSNSQAIYLPLLSSNGVLGIFGYKPATYKPHLSQGNIDLLFTVARELSGFFERELFREQASQTMRSQIKIVAQ